VWANAPAVIFEGKMAEDRELLRTSKDWLVAEAVSLLERVEKNPPEKGYVLFETGYGPSVRYRHVAESDTEREPDGSPAPR
jgi:hypothetical protein